MQLDGLVKVFKDGHIWQIGTSREVRASDGVLPDLFFPEDRSWLVSALWDDTWTCVGGSNTLIEALEHDPLVRTYRVTPDVDAMPPGPYRD